MCLGISIVNFTYSYDPQNRFLHISGTYWPTTPIVSHTKKKDIRVHLCKADISHKHLCWFQQQKLRISTAEPAVFLPLRPPPYFFFHVSSTVVNGFVAVVWKRSFIFLKICSMPQYSSFFVKEDEKTVNSQNMHNSKVLSMDVGYGNSFFLSSSSSGLDHKAAHPSNYFFFFMFFIDGHQLVVVSHLQYPSVSQWISFLINFLPNFLYE